MKRLLRFLSLMALRFMAVCTVVIWGASQVRVIVANVNCGIGSLSVTGAPDGFVFASPVSPARAAGIKFRDADDILTWEGMYEVRGRFGVDRKSHFAGGALWMRRNSHSVAVAVRYWLALTGLLLAYAMVQFLTRTKRLSRMVELEL